MSRKDTILARIYKEDQDFIRKEFPKLSMAQTVNLSLKFLKETDIISVGRMQRSVRDVRKKR